ncbi:hypothetical protein [Polymorphobacter multimanifer]|uniref:Uncharacterized protein n=1 Tax=Polymorphobacter multimanifer TaxID=1070431 RepID=A0A841LES8_9SPHN|nr:hypothetical protein [Polymorphobacter multimanifer]MBB6228315.1 hypothetical protein [Polymorphobacter multimanifer]
MASGLLGDQTAEQGLDFGMLRQGAGVGKIKMQPHAFDGGGAGAGGDVMEGGGGHASP